MDRINSKIIIAVLVALSFVGGYYLGTKAKRTYPPLFASFSKMNQSAPNEVHSVAGSIKEIGENFLIVAPDKKGETDKKIIISKDTKFSSVETGTGFSSGFGFGFGKTGAEKPKNKQEKALDMFALKVGDEIIAGTPENIEGKTEFTAEMITILRQKKKE